MARKPNLRDLSRLPPEYDDLTALIKIFKEEHPVAAAILGAGLVEHGLETLLRSRFKLQDDETWAMLTRDNGPLKSFYFKIAMGYALGIYDQRMHDDLNIVRNIRNAFAHSKS
jgi:DNA-binding MltR family transcriptional regulator